MKFREASTNTDAISLARLAGASPFLAQRLIARSSVRLRLLAPLPPLVGPVPRA